MQDTGQEHQATGQGLSLGGPKMRYVQTRCPRLG